MSRETVATVGQGAPAPPLRLSPTCLKLTAESWPLSPGQQRIYLAEQLSGQSPVYNVAMKLEIDGDLDQEVLRSAFALLVERHEALRTNFVVQPSGEVLQVLTPAPTVIVPFRDLSSSAEAERQSEIQQLELEIARQRFDLAHDQMLRSILVRCSPSSHLLLLVIHHIVVDRWSVKILLRELFEIYRASLEHRAPVLDESAIRHTDYARAREEWLEAGVREKQLAFWKGSLSGDPELHPLKPDLARPRHQTFRGARETSAIPKSLVHALRELGQRQRTSLFMVLLAAFQSLLHRYSGQDEIAVSYPVAGRSRAETRNLVGFFVNTLLATAGFADNPTFHELLRRVRNSILDGYECQDVPFEEILKVSPAAGQNRNRSPVQTMFVLQESPLDGLAVPGLRLTWSELETGTSKLDLLLTIENGDEELEVVAEYNPDLFRAETVRGFLRHYIAMLDSVATDPEVRVGNIELISEAERHQQLTEWNRTERSYPQVCVHQLFEAQARSRPKSIALTAEHRNVSYSELNNLANHIAVSLRDLGISADTRVGVCGDRTPETIAALIGILKAGGGYVPVDASYPEERLQFMVRDAALEVILAEAKYADQMRKVAKHVVCLESLRQAASLESLPNVVSDVSPDSLAYVLYTSGSTGDPKGVEIPHRGIVRLLFGNGFAELDDSRVFLQLAPLSFDASTFEIWGALLHGGRCVLYPDPIPLLSKLEATIRHHGVTTLWLTSSLFNCIVDERPQSLLPIRELFTGGESLSVSHVRRALDLLPGTRLFNGYGPTESTTFTCTYQIPREFDANADSVPIGKPIGNTQVYVLDRYQQPVPVGVPGELCIAGDGLARGYLNRKEITQQSFVQHPLADGTKRRVYRSGDIVRYRRDGNLEFLYRMDAQVKINGFRIELGEIESAVHACPSVKAAAVVVREQAPLGKQIVAYVATSDQSEHTELEIRNFLERRLPEFEMPDEFVLLQQLPLTPNGKLDRRNLPASGNRRGTEAPLIVPRTATEVKLLEIWQELLGRCDIGTNQDFFNLGGNSLLVARLLTRVETAFGRRLDVATVFDAPTIAELALRVRSTNPNPRARRVFSIKPVGSRAPFFCVGAGPFLRPLAKAMAQDQPFLGLGLSHEDKQWLRTSSSLEEIAAHLVTSLRECQPEGPYFLGGWCHDGVMAFEIARQLQEQGEQVSLLALFDCQNPAWQPTQSVRDRVRMLVSRVSHYSRILVSRELKFSPASWRDRMLDKYVRMKRARGAARIASNDATVDDTPANDLLEGALFKAVTTYRPRLYRGPVKIFQCKVRPSGIYWDSAASWRSIVDQEMQTFEIPGDHRSMFSEPNVGVLAAHLESCIQSVSSANPRR